MLQNIQQFIWFFFITRAQIFIVVFTSPWLNFNCTNSMLILYLKAYWHGFMAKTTLRDFKQVIFLKQYFRVLVRVLSLRLIRLKVVLHGLLWKGHTNINVVISVIWNEYYKYESWIKFTKQTVYQIEVLYGKKYTVLKKMIINFVEYQLI